jgi:hypothetical protein
MELIGIVGGAFTLIGLAMLVLTLSVVDAPRRALHRLGYLTSGWLGRRH